jgi:hypothetical protein
MLALLQDQSRIAELRKVKRKRAVRNSECVGNRTCGHALFARLDQQPEQGETMFLRKRGERFDGIVRTHASGSWPNAPRWRSTALAGEKHTPPKWLAGSW